MSIPDRAERGGRTSYKESRKTICMLPSSSSSHQHHQIYKYERFYPLYIHIIKCCSTKCNMQAVQVLNAHNFGSFDMIHCLHSIFVWPVARCAGTLPGWLNARSVNSYETLTSLTSWSKWAGFCVIGFIAKYCQRQCVQNIIASGKLGDGPQSIPMECEHKHIYRRVYTVQMVTGDSVVNRQQICTHYIAGTHSRWLSVRKNTVYDFVDRCDT